MIRTGVCRAGWSVEPRSQVETAIEIPRAQRSANARAFAAGTGVTAALIAAAILAFVSVAAFVAFDGMPFGSGDTPETVVTVSGAPKAAALSAGSTAEVVVAAPAAPSAEALAEIVAALPPSLAAGPGPGANLGGASTRSTGPGTPGATNTPGSGGGTDAPVDVFGESTPGPVQGAVGAVDDVTGGLGLELRLGEATNGLTKGIDNAVGGTLNDVGNGLGAGNLGDKTSDAIGGVTNGATNGLHGLLD